jgi:NAD(P)-dependent dehydrogenase (short-subunit alcohol dehydrogenase family)
MQSELRNQTVVVIGGTSGIGLEAARRARAEGAQVILTARHPERLEEVARDVDALKSTALTQTISHLCSLSFLLCQRLMWPRSLFTS